MARFERALSASADLPALPLEMRSRRKSSATMSPSMIFGSGSGSSVSSTKGTSKSSELDEDHVDAKTVQGEKNQKGNQPVNEKAQMSA